MAQGARVRQRTIETSRPAAFWPWLLLLGAAAGLVVVGVLSLFQALSSARDTALVEARRSGRATAQALAALLQHPEFLTLAPVTSQFTIEAGRLRIPPEIGWLEPRPKLPFPERLPRRARLLVEEARRLEYLDGDREHATTLWERALEVTGLTPVDRLWIANSLYRVECGRTALLGRPQREEHFTTRAAPERSDTQAHVAAASAGRCEALLEEVRTAYAGLPHGTPVPDGLIGALILLFAFHDHDVPGTLAAAFSRIRPEMGRALLAQLDRVPPLIPMANALGARLQDIASTRRTHALARDLVPQLLEQKRPVRLEPGGSVVFFFPGAIESGTGAILAPATVVELIERDRRAGGRMFAATGGTGRVVAAGETEDAVPVVAGLELVPDAPLPTSDAPERALILLPVALAGFLVVGVVLALRGVRREHLATRARTEFLTAVTHELKTPLATIRLLVDVLGDARADEEKRARYRHRLAGETARLSMLVENVLDLGRLERGERAYDLRQENLREVIREALELYAPLAARDQLELEQNLGTEPVVVTIDRGALVQVLLNLLENARRYGADGGRIRVNDAVVGDVYRCWISDDGPGVPPAERGAIFAKFHRGVNATAGGNPGVGLGLYLARAIVGDHGGDLSCVDPNDGSRGAAFRLTVPLEATADDGPAA